jgi:hypothetical protein
MSPLDRSVLRTLMAAVYARIGTMTIPQAEAERRFETLVQWIDAYAQRKERK